MSLVSRLLGNLSVGAKLSIGFGLVLLFTLGVGITAFHSLSLLGRRGEEVRAEDWMQTVVLRARLAE